MASTDQSYKPALRFSPLTPLFDPAVALMSRERAFKRLVVRHASIRPGDAVLDLGCGTGTLALAAHRDQPAADFTGLDADPAILERARAKARSADAPLSFDRGFANELPYPAGRFDVVLSTLFFHHLDDPTKRETAGEIMRVLKPNGRLVVGDYGRPHDPIMRVAVAGVQLLDGRETTSLNVAGKLPALLSDQGLVDVTVADRLRTPTGTIEIIVARRDTEVD